MRLMAIVLAAAGAVSVLAAAVPAKADTVVRRETIVRHPMHRYAYHRPSRAYHHDSTTIVKETVR